jgi:cell fate regulator YaaT (PSP1 superfamily)
MSAYIEVQFKGNRRLTYTNPMNFPVKLGDDVIVEAEKGEDIGRVVQITDVDRITLEEERHTVRPVVRKAGPHDYQRQQRNEEREPVAEEACRALIREHHLRMKLVNVEYQLDGKKVTFFFTAEGRIDFRNLVKDLAGSLRTRIDLRQIGARDEAKKFGGYGPCGQRQCCSAFLPRFDSVTTSMAKVQNLPLNPIKLSGNCGRLKCCLRYELDFYKSQFDRFPSVDTAVETLRGLALVDKIDIFREEVTIRYTDGDMDVLSHEALMKFMAIKPGEMNCKSSCGSCGAGDVKAFEEEVNRRVEENTGRRPSTAPDLSDTTLVASAEPEAGERRQRENPRRDFGDRRTTPRRERPAGEPAGDTGTDGEVAGPEEARGPREAGSEGGEAPRRRRGGRRGGRGRRPGEQGPAAPDA